jgi:uncharacterized protein
MPLAKTLGLLLISNLFMIFAWYAHLKDLKSKPLILAVFAPFALFYMKAPLTWNYAWSGLCLLGAVYFIFKSG